MEVEEPFLTALDFPPGEISMKSWKEVVNLGPFGNGNPAPLFFVSGPAGKIASPWKGWTSPSDRIRKRTAAGLRRGTFPERNFIILRLALPSRRLLAGRERLQFIVDYIVTGDIG